MAADRESSIWRIRDWPDGGKRAAEPLEVTPSCPGEAPTGFNGRCEFAFVERSLTRSIAVAATASTPLGCRAQHPSTA